MPFVITAPCIGVKDTACVEICPVDCIYGGAESGDMCWIHPEECIDCALCVDACPVEAIYPEEKVPKKWKKFIDLSYSHFGLTPP